MKITVVKTGGIAGLHKQLGPVDTERESDTVASAITRLVGEIDFFDLPPDTKPGGAFDDFRFSVHITDSDEENEVSYDGLSNDPVAAQLRELVGLLEQHGFEFRGTA